MSTSHPKRRSDSGFTLLEVLIAMALMGVGILTIALAQLTAIKMSSKSKHQAQAMYLAKEKMDELAAMPGTSALFNSDTNGNNDPLNPISVVAASPNETTTYNRTWDIDADNPQVGLTTITVIVRWSNADQAKVQSIRLVTVKSQSL